MWFGPRSRPAPALLLAAVVLAGCGCGASGGSQDVTHRQSRLVVTGTDATGGGARTWTLTCDPPGGDHPDPDGACRTLDAASAPFASVPAGMMCTQVYGGPETATIEGTWRGEPVRAEYKRTDGCEIARWNALTAVLGGGGTGS